jgi:hypothetical protein
MITSLRWLVLIITFRDMMHSIRITEMYKVEKTRRLGFRTKSNEL